MFTDACLKTACVYVINISCQQQKRWKKQRNQVNLLRNLEISKAIKLFISGLASIYLSLK